MEDFSFKLHEIKEGGNSKKPIKIILIILTCLFLFLIFVKIIKLINNNRDSSNPDTVTLIKAPEKSIKRIPDEKGGLNIENLDIGVYNVIDEQEKDNIEPTVNKSSQDVTVKDNEIFERKGLNEQVLLTDKIDEINQNDKIIVSGDTFKNNTNIKINTEKAQATNFDSLKQLGNDALIRNLKNKNYIKPGIKVQLLALKSRKSIETYWEELTSKYNNLFDEKSYYIEKIDLNESTSIYRLQVGMFANFEAAYSFCRDYIKITNKNKVDCIVVK